MITKLTAWALLLPLSLPAQEQHYNQSGIGFSVAWTAGAAPKLGEGGASVMLFKPGKVWAAGLLVNFGTGEAAHYPADYDAGLVIFGNGKPAETFWSITPVVTRLTPVNGRRWMFYVSGGPSLTQVDRIVEYQQLNRGWFNFGSNYNVITKKETLPGFRAEAGMIMRIGRIGGLNFGPFLSANSWKTVPGFKLGMSFGMHKKLFWK